MFMYSHILVYKAILFRKAKLKYLLLQGLSSYLLDYSTRLSRASYVVISSWWFTIIGCDLLYNECIKHFNIVLF